MVTSKRKIEHLDICTRENVESYGNGFDDIEFVHRCLPEINKSEISTKTSFLGHKFEAPIMIASMTGGHPETKAVNANLAVAAEALGIGIGVGSQRAALEDSRLEDSYRIVRDSAPSAFIYGNIGAPQLSKYSIEDLERAVEMIDADAMAIHLNFLQEAIQPEGDIDARGCLEKIAEVASSLSVPVIIKETGAGICHIDAYTLKKAGIGAIDVGGKGGTSWAGVEVYRARMESDELGEHLGMKFWDWGIPTAVSIVEADIGLPLIATGGIRDGIMVAKSIALGASMSGIALPLVAPARVSAEKVKKQLELYIEELKATMFLTGSKSVEGLKRAPIVIHGKTRDTLEARGFNWKNYSQR
ncbi:type 2 isopentenyl-diphosphate Delta-isomerase [Methanocella sp. CWC-04]|uniref:Isopentenyl-diphosphate delta-isomerase n=1 Tax=Methanooceanicella nereidis TaxID=2052831 RepID=A0AAP2RBB6_9EURY|nr:type 2 isopentenyl-diphosphate Delta-isomerase [Methanocella sp. CWC-04]MCD1293887.1 type 2 isopentenyl-diphosphate Delta-isomerase [Methanocella sp. CWC-04]